MAEDPERQTRRIALSKEQAKLAQAQEWLRSVHPQDDGDEEMMESEATLGENDMYDDA